MAELSKSIQETKTVLKRYDYLLDPTNVFSSEEEVRTFFESNSFSVKELTTLKPTRKNKDNSILGYGVVIEKP